MPDRFDTFQHSSRWALRILGFRIRFLYTDSLFRAYSLPLGWSIVRTGPNNCVIIDAKEIERVKLFYSPDAIKPTASAEVLTRYCVKQPVCQQGSWYVYDNATGDIDFPPESAVRQLTENEVKQYANKRYPRWQNPCTHWPDLIPIPYRRLRLI
jgi:hypothetical protein